MNTEQYENNKIAALVSQAKQGDEEAFVQLYKRTSYMIYKNSLSILKDFELALDTVQEVYEIVFCSLKNLRCDTAFVSWLNTITCRVSYKMMEYQKELPMEMQYLELCMEQQGKNPLDQILRQEEIEEIISIVSELPKNQRRFVIKKYFDGMKLREIASQEQCPLGTVKSGLNSAKIAIRKKINR